MPRIQLDNQIVSFNNSHILSIKPYKGQILERKTYGSRKLDNKVLSLLATNKLSFNDFIHDNFDINNLINYN